MRSSPDILYIPRPGTKPPQIIHVICRILNTQMICDRPIAFEARSPFDIDKCALAPNMRGYLLGPGPLFIRAPDGLVAEPTWRIDSNTISGEIHVNSVRAQECEELKA